MMMRGLAFRSAPSEIATPPAIQVAAPPSDEIAASAAHTGLSQPLDSIDLTEATQTPAKKRKYISDFFAKK